VKRETWRREEESQNKKNAPEERGMWGLLCY